VTAVGAATGSATPAKRRKPWVSTVLLDFCIESARLFQMALKLEQGQIWKKGEEFIRIVRLERLEVGYKTFKDLNTGQGMHHHTTKKEFCRLIKNATLLGLKPPVISEGDPGEGQAPTSPEENPV
jgi:hypothetical protein